MRGEDEAGGKQEKVGVSIARLIGYVAVLFLATVLLAIVLLIFEALSRFPDAVEWAQAIGGLGAVFAAAMIAGAEARRSNKLLATQIRMQRELLDHDIKVRDAQRHEQLVVITETVKAAFGLLHFMSEDLNTVDGKSDWTAFMRAWGQDLATSNRIISSVSLSSIYDTTKLKKFADILVEFADYSKDLESACEVEDARANDRLFYRFLLKGHVNRIRDLLKFIDPLWDCNHAPLEILQSERDEYERALNKGRHG